MPYFPRFGQCGCEVTFNSRNYAIVPDDTIVHESATWFDADGVEKRFISQPSVGGPYARFGSSFLTL